ncbi:MAG TPA: SpoIID/LytB domain-containing protein [Vicinamibacteria bacterium]|nr:SpoIID/LytB domain-containing protein [Vicinamibacteria bacterium]
MSWHLRPSRRGLYLLLTAAGLGAAAGSCRTLGPGVRPAAPVATVQELVAAQVPPPLLRVGILTEATRASIGADAGIVVRAGPTGAIATKVMRATFVPVAENPDLLRLVETGDTMSVATLFPASGGDGLNLEAAPYRGLLEVRANGTGGLTVINIVNLEDYLKGVVPNELSPNAYPQIEALKAQAVAARTYALRNLGQYKLKGFDICATPACQVYRGRSSESPLSDRAVDETRGQAASHRGRLINALYTSTCGGHTEDGSTVFEGEETPYLRGVACAPEQSAWVTVKTLAKPLAFEGFDTLGRDAAVLASLGVLEPKQLSAQAMKGAASDAEVRGWTEKLVAALHRKGCDSGVEPPLARRGSLFAHLVGALCWQERAERLLAPGDADYLLHLEDRAALRDAEKEAAALLIQEGLLTPFPDNTIRPDIVVSRAQAVSLLAQAGLKAGGPALLTAEFQEANAEGLLLKRGEAVEALAVDPQVRLFRSLDGLPLAASELSLAMGDKVRYVVRDGRIVFFEAEESRLGAAADHSSRYYRWEVSLSPAEVGKAVARYGTVGQVRELVPRRLGVSGRVVELMVQGSDGDLLLQGLRVRWGLGLRENLFVIDRELDASGAVRRFVFTGKGWGHGVGLCQVGAFGMARAGSDYRAILKHYYTGISLSEVTP